MAWHDHVTHRPARTLDALAALEGAVVEVDGERVAAYLDPSRQPLLPLMGACWPAWPWRHRDGPRQE